MIVVYNEIDYLWVIVWYANIVVFLIINDVIFAIVLIMINFMILVCELYQVFYRNHKIILF